MRLLQVYVIRDCGKYPRLITGVKLSSDARIACIGFFLGRLLMQCNVSTQTNLTHRQPIITNSTSTVSWATRDSAHARARLRDGRASCFPSRGCSGLLVHHPCRVVPSQFQSPQYAGMGQRETGADGTYYDGVSG